MGGERRALGGEGWRGVAASGLPVRHESRCVVVDASGAAAASRAAVLAKVVVPELRKYPLGYGGATAGSRTRVPSLEGLDDDRYTTVDDAALLNKILFCTI